MNPLSEKPYYIMTNTGLYWISKNLSDTSIIMMDLPNISTFDVVMLQESMKDGQRIKKFRLEFWDGKHWIKFTEGTTIGYKRLLRFPPVTSKQIRMVIEASRSAATLVTFNLYKLPSGISFESK
jgi:alpha-L-fucosidase